ncbi:Ferritin, Dps family protein [Thermosinus carboxydivorans Nor1]|uniref:Ferritin n=1 Tax=Thermosinus carboxydivorans Nor1 TaxID=401526 RepID=A1HUD0_9FIRM|nr:ferritin [Thermosinus carboxydivorans]EAX46367.1 Ferritin, Dps family protein [Thermosinus carboxydivorans Nor1]
MISAKMQDALNRQIQAEFQSAYLYLAMSAYCESKNLKGFAHWLKVQYQEETGHALKILDYLLERGGTAELKAIEAPSVEFGSPAEIFEKVLAHEQHITSLIHNLYETAVAEKDLATQVFLQWFITEQVEEEASASDVLERIKMVGDRSSSILYLDKELGKREG